jgi:two-component system OmpR family response regulator
LATELVDSGAPRRRRAIVCEADAISSRLLAEILHRADFEVVVCKTATECESEAQRGVTDLIVTAILLPDFDGLELTRRLRVSYPCLRILVVSVLHAARRAIQAGADVFLNKPVSAALLTETASQLVPLGGLHPS